LKSGFRLKEVAGDYLGLPDWSQDEGVWEDIKSIDPRNLIFYGALDAYATLELGMLFYRIHRKHYPFMLQLHVECKNAVFAFREQSQVLDKEYLEGLSKGLNEQIEDLKKNFFSTYGTINLASSQQKSALLFKLGWSTGVFNKPDKNGNAIMSTAEKALEPLIKKGCEPAAMMIRYNKLLKLKGSYVDVMLSAASSGNPVRLNIKDHDTATLRFSAGKYSVNRKPYEYYLGASIQCLPKPHKINRELNYDPSTFEIEWPSGPGEYYVESGSPDMNIRKAFGSNPGGIIIKADFAQEELVIPAVLSGETTWLDAIKRGEDLHNATGRMMHGRDIAGDERKSIKGINFGIMYETENPEYVISNQTGWPIEQSREFFAKYKSALSRLYAWKEKVIMEGRTTGSIRNLYGFERRVYSYYHTANRAMQKFGDRTCVNTSVQTLAAIMFRILCVKFWKMLYLKQGQFYGAGISFLAPVHDELVLRADDKTVLPEFLPVFKKTMEDVTPKGWPVSLRAEVEIGQNFGESFVVERDEASGLWLPKEEDRPVAVVGTDITATSQVDIDSWVEETEGELAEFEGFSFGAVS
jgi:DNA polymerase-1